MDQHTIPKRVTALALSAVLAISLIPLAPYTANADELTSGTIANVDTRKDMSEWCASRTKLALKYDYDGKPITPFGQSNDDLTVTYKNNVKPGTATVCMVANPNSTICKGSGTITFTIRKADRNTAVLHKTTVKVPKARKLTRSFTYPDGGKGSRTIEWYSKAEANRYVDGWGALWPTYKKNGYDYGTATCTPGAKAQVAKVYKVKASTLNTGEKVTFALPKPKALDATAKTTAMKWSYTKPDDYNTKAIGAYGAVVYTHNSYANAISSVKGSKLTLQLKNADLRQFKAHRGLYKLKLMNTIKGDKCFEKKNCSVTIAIKIV